MSRRKPLPQLSMIETSNHSDGFPATAGRKTSSPQRRPILDHHEALPLDTSATNVSELGRPEETL